MGLVFPLDIDETQYQAKVSFQAVKLRSVDVAAIFSGAGQALSVGTGATATGAAGDGNRGSVSTAAHYGNDTNVTTIEGTNQIVERRLGRAVLYLPQAVQIVDGAQYDNIDLGILGAGTMQGLQEGAALIPTLMDQTVQGVQSIVDAFRSTSLGTPVGRLAVSRAAQYLPSEAATGAVRSGTRTTVNPNTRALFKSVPLREFTFQFKMIPTSPEETQNIKDIIKFFRTELYPKVIPLGDIPAGYEFPNVFEIMMYYKNTNNHLATKILPSYLKNFSATYNASSMGFYEGGDFTEVDISMTFVESSTLHRDLVESKGY